MFKLDQLPGSVLAVFREYQVCEFTTLNRSGVPVTWPTLPFVDAAANRIIVSTSSLIEPGPASLPLHSFNDQLWDLQSYMVRGTLIQHETGCIKKEAGL